MSHKNKTLHLKPHVQHMVEFRKMCNVRLELKYLLTSVTFEMGKKFSFEN